jgi:hypothetical protein
LSGVLPLASLDAEKPVLSASSALGVGQPTIRAAVFKFTEPDPRAALLSRLSELLVLSIAAGVGHPEYPMSDVRRTDPRRRKNDRRDGVAATFQISAYKVEPRPSVRAVNLLPKDEARAALADEPLPVGS